MEISVADLSTVKQEPTENNDAKVESEEKNIMICGICRETFTCVDDLSKHVTLHAVGTKVTQELSATKVVSPDPAQITGIKTKAGKVYPCATCDKRFKRKCNLLAHIRIHTGDKPFKCDICFQFFSNSSNLVRHKRIHTGDQPYVCDVCDRSFSQSSNLVAHKKIHSETKPFVCEICDKGFINKAYRDAHLMIHKGDKQYKCSICNKSFYYRGNLYTHMKIHSGEKPYRCDVCDKRFYISSHLSRHMRIHTGERPYECSICSESFTRVCSLTKHKQRFHKPVMSNEVLDEHDVSTQSLFLGEDHGSPNESLTDESVSKYMEESQNESIYIDQAEESLSDHDLSSSKSMIMTDEGIAIVTKCQT